MKFFANCFYYCILLILSIVVAALYTVQFTHGSLFDWKIIFNLSYKKGECSTAFCCATPLLGEKVACYKKNYIILKIAYCHASKMNVVKLVASLLIAATPQTLIFYTYTAQCICCGHVTSCSCDFKYRPFLQLPKPNITYSRNYYYYYYNSPNINYWKVQICAVFNTLDHIILLYWATVAFFSENWLNFLHILMMGSSTSEVILSKNEWFDFP